MSALARRHHVRHENIGRQTRWHQEAVGILRKVKPARSSKKKQTLEQTFRRTRRMKRALGSVAYFANVVLITPRRGTVGSVWILLTGGPAFRTRNCGSSAYCNTVAALRQGRLGPNACTIDSTGIIQHGLELCHAPRQSGARLHSLPSLQWFVFGILLKTYPYFIPCWASNVHCTRELEDQPRPDPGT